MQSTEDFWTKVDRTGDCWVWKASKTQSQYGRYRGADGRHRAAHRISWEMENGPIPEGMYIDHMCHNRSCVRPDHLRLATPKQNLENLRGLTAANKSGFRGVCWNKKYGWWQATVVHNYERHFLGYFATAEEAGAAALAKRMELYTHNDLDYAEAESLKKIKRQVFSCGAATLAGGSCSVRVRAAGAKCHRHAQARSDVQP